MKLFDLAVFIERRSRELRRIDVQKGSELKELALRCGVCEVADSGERPERAIQAVRNFIAGLNHSGPNGKERNHASPPVSPFWRTLLELASELEKVGPDVDKQVAMLVDQIESMPKSVVDVHIENLEILGVAITELLLRARTH